MFTPSYQRVFSNESTKLQLWALKCGFIGHEILCNGFPLTTKTPHKWHISVSSKHLLPPIHISQNTNGRFKPLTMWNYWSKPSLFCTLAKSTKSCGQLHLDLTTNCISIKLQHINYSKCNNFTNVWLLTSFIVICVSWGNMFEEMWILAPQTFISQYYYLIAL
jgi:hypothetical protein